MEYSIIFWILFSCGWLLFILSEILTFVPKKYVKARGVLKIIINIMGRFLASAVPSSNYAPPTVVTMGDVTKTTNVTWHAF